MNWKDVRPGHILVPTFWDDWNTTALVLKVQQIDEELDPEVCLCVDVLLTMRGDTQILTWKNCCNGKDIFDYCWKLA